MTRRWYVWAAVALVSTQLACAQLGFQLPASEEERQAWAEARRNAEEAGDPRDAYEAFLARYPDSALAGDAALELARLAHRDGDLATAKARYQQAAQSGGVAGDRARVQLAVLAFEDGDSAAARGWLDRVRLSRLDDADLRNAYRVHAATSEDAVERVRWLSLLRTKVPDPSAMAEVDLEIDGILAELTVDELREAARGLGDRPPAGRVYVVLTERALEANDVEAAAEALEGAKRRPLAPRYATRLAALESRVRAREAGPIDVGELPSFEQAAIRPRPVWTSARGSIGVAVPLSGPFARFGEHVLQGVLLAADTFGRESGPELRILVRDTAGDPERAAAAVRDLAEQDVAAIIGPLVGRACEAAAVEAERARVPLLAVTPRESVATGREWVFRLRTRPQEEVQLLADRARALGAERFAILYPNDNYGLGLRALFWDAVEARGGSIVSVASFDPAATDFSDPIRRLVGYTLLDNEEKRLIGQRGSMLERARRLPPRDARVLRKQARALTRRDGRPIPPIVDFEALFLPASQDDFVLIAPQLAFHDLTGARLLGTDGALDAELVRLAGDHIEGAVFASHFHARSEVAYVADFVDAYERVFGVPPDAFAAQGYDAAGLVALQLARGDSRAGVRDGLLRTVAHPGVSGVLTMRADGNAQKRPFLLGVEDGAVIEYTD